MFPEAPETHSIPSNAFWVCLKLLIMHMTKSTAMLGGTTPAITVESKNFNTTIWIAVKHIILYSGLTTTSNIIMQICFYADQVVSGEIT